MLVSGEKERNERIYGVAVGPVLLILSLPLSRFCHRFRCVLWRGVETEIAQTKEVQGGVSNLRWNLGIKISGEVAR